jgi:hypothetical protein
MHKPIFFIAILLVELSLNDFGRKIVIHSFERRGCWKDPDTVGRPCDCVIPAWSAGIQIDMDVSGRILRAWMPAVHAGMTEEKFVICPYAFHVLGERKIMKHFVLIFFPAFTILVPQRPPDALGR